MRFLISIFALLAPVPALALSCLPQTVEGTYQRAADSEDVYIVVHGRLTFNAAKLPRNGSATHTPDRMTRIPAEIQGKSLSKAGFKVPFDQKITLEVACYGPWCGSAQSGQDVLAFLKRGPDGYSLESNPCGGNLFGTPKVGMLKQVRTCFNGGACAATR
jgi:hypothetical protein